MDDRRSDGRKPTFKSGKIQIGGASRMVTILNLSGGGAMIDGSEPLDEDAELLFECADTGEVRARVAWVLGNRCGLTFERVVELGHRNVAA